MPTGRLLNTTWATCRASLFKHFQTSVMSLLSKHRVTDKCAKCQHWTKRSVNSNESSKQQGYKIHRGEGSAKNQSTFNKVQFFGSQMSFTFNKFGMNSTANHYSIHLHPNKHSCYHEADVLLHVNVLPKPQMTKNAKSF